MPLPSELATTRGLEIRRLTQSGVFADVNSVLFACGAGLLVGIPGRFPSWSRCRAINSMRDEKILGSVSQVCDPVTLSSSGLTVMKVDEIDG